MECFLKLFTKIGTGLVLCLCASLANAVETTTDLPCVRNAMSVDGIVIGAAISLTNPNETADSLATRMAIISENPCLHVDLADISTGASFEGMREPTSINMFVVPRKNRAACVVSAPQYAAEVKQEISKLQAAAAANQINLYCVDGGLNTLKGE